MAGNSDNVARWPTWVELNLAVLRGNIAAVRRALAPATDLIFVVKSDAYGHGMVPVAREAWASGVKAFAVAHLHEAVSLRRHLPQARILILGSIRPKDVAEAMELRLQPVLAGESHAAALAGAARTAQGTLDCHAEVDTGMGRLGIDWQEAPAVLARVARLPGLNVFGLCSHFASADSPDSEFAGIQAQRFKRVVDACEASGLRFLYRHLSNSGGLLRSREWDWDAVRIGILLYGYGPRVSAGEPRAATSPFLQWKTRVILVKDVPAGFPLSYGSTHVTPRPTRIATLYAGYSDGYSRLLSNRGEVLLGGRRCPVAGRVTMNHLMVDAGPDADAREGDEAVLLGASGRESMWADEMAARCGTIPYEILTGIRTGHRVALNASADGTDRKAPA